MINQVLNKKVCAYPTKMISMNGTKGQSKDVPLVKLHYISRAVVEDEPHQHKNQYVFHGLGTNNWEIIVILGLKNWCDDKEANRIL